MEKQNKSEKEQIDAELQYLRKMLSTPEGKEFAWRLLERAGIYRNAFTGNAPQTDYNCGMQAVGQWFLSEALIAHPKAISEVIINNVK
jgi:hypothetical protein